MRIVNRREARVSIHRRSTEDSIDFYTVIFHQNASLYTTLWIHKWIPVFKDNIGRSKWSMCMIIYNYCRMAQHTTSLSLRCTTPIAIKRHRVVMHFCLFWLRYNTFSVRWHVVWIRGLLEKFSLDKHLEMIITSIIYTNILFMQCLIVLILNMKKEKFKA